MSTQAVLIREVKDLRPGDYFLAPGACTGFRLHPESGEIVRLNDGASVTGLFPRDNRVVLVAREVAVAAALAYRNS